jgi:hypothetical protein
MKHRLAAVMVAVPLAVIAVFVVRGADTGTFPHIEAPKNASALPPTTPSTAPIDLTAVSLVGVDGTTTTTPVRSLGTAHVSGFVKGPDGPVPGATVRFEHLAGPAVRTDVTSGPDGHYDAPNMAGGRYRVRAFLAPSLAQTDPVVFFLTDGELRGLDLTVDSFTPFAVNSAMAPDPPLRDQQATFVVRVGARSVDGDGIVRVQPVANAIVDLTGTQGWSVSTAASAVTDAGGDATFTLVCRNAGTNQVQVQVRPTVNDLPQPATLTTPACVDPAATTTTSSGSSSGSSGSSQSQSSSSGN